MSCEHREHGGRDQSQVKIKFKKFEKIKSVPKDVPESHNDDSVSHHQTRNQISQLSKQIHSSTYHGLDICHRMVQTSTNNPHQLMTCIDCCGVWPLVVMPIPLLCALLHLSCARTGASDDDEWPQNQKK